MVKNIWLKLSLLLQLIPGTIIEGVTEGVTILIPLLTSFIIPGWGPGPGILQTKPLKIKRTLPKTPIGVPIMDQTRVRGFGAEEGAPGETMVQNDLKIQVGVGKVRGQCSHKHHDYRSQTKFPHKTHSFPTASSSCQDFQAQSTEPKTLHSILPGKEHNQGTSRSSIPVLFESFPCTKKANSFRPVINLSQLKPPSKCSEIQDGVCPQDSTVLVGTLWASL